jgi:predicted amidohydrolase YtcJ
MEPVSAVIPPPGPADREAALRAAMRLALRHGITQVHDMGALQSPDESWASLETLRALHARGKPSRSGCPPRSPSPSGSGWPSGWPRWAGATSASGGGR